MEREHVPEHDRLANSTEHAPGDRGCALGDDRTLGGAGQFDPTHQCAGIAEVDFVSKWHPGASTTAVAEVSGDPDRLHTEFQRRFDEMKPGRRRGVIHHIASAKSEETVAKRIVRLMEELGMAEP